MSILKAFFSGRLIPTCRQGFFLFLVTGITGFTVFFGVDTLAQGNLLITPRRVVFEGNRRSFDLSLSNTGQDTSTYSISLIQIRMTENGGFEQITEPDPGQKFADKYIRFIPRSVTLGPNESQTVKVQVQKSNDIEPGEYRSHFYFRAEPKPTPLGEKEKSGEDTTAISIKITPIFGITIPVIIRIGESNTKVSLTDLELSLLNDTIPTIKFTFNRSGNMSVFGDITVDHISTQGKITRVGIANGVAVYTPNTVRKFQLNLNRVAGVDFKTGTLRVVYSTTSDVKPFRLAEAEVTIRK
jgi:hypothetical protein